MSNNTNPKVYGLIFIFVYENISLFATSQGYEKRFNLMKLKYKMQRIRLNKYT